MQTVVPGRRRHTYFAIRQFERKTAFPLFVYLHPWEIDPHQPRIAGKLESQLRRCRNRNAIQAKLRALRPRHEFGPLRDSMERKQRWLVHIRISNDDLGETLPASFYRRNGIP